MQLSRISALLAAVIAFAVVVPSASAQDYTQNEVSGQYVTIPATANQITGINNNQITEVELPFEFPYYGGIADRIYVHDNGYVQILPATVPNGYSPWTNETFPPNTINTTDAMVAVHWDDLWPMVANCKVGTFTTGTAPNRKFVVYWSNITHITNTTSTSYSFQLHLYEGSGRIVFAYASPTSAWTGNSYSLGLLAPGSTDTRYTTPSTSASNAGHPGTDYQFDPDVTTITGTVLFDAVLSDDSGIGNAVDEDAVPAGMRIELHTKHGLGATGTVGEDGSFTLRGYALDSQAAGTLYLVAESAACRVSPSAPDAPAATYAIQLADEIDLSSDVSLGTLTVDDTNDADFSRRGPIQIAHTIGRAHAWIDARTDDDLGRLEVYFSSSSLYPTAFVRARVDDPAHVRIAGSSTANRDEFDRSVVLRGYARHLLERLCGVTPTNSSMELDSVTDDATALADGLGLYLLAVLDGVDVTYDGIDGETTTVIDLENPDFETARGPTVGGWYGAALFDLIDGANEDHDAVDGTQTGAAARVLEVIDALSGPVSVDDIVTEWDDQGYDATDLVAVLVHHGLLSDDANEPDDTAETATFVGTAGLRVPGQTLNRFNEDWFRVQVDDVGAHFLVDVTYNRSAYVADVALELRTLDGKLLATGSYDGPAGPIRAEIASFGPGPLLIRVAHTGGEAIGDYALQAFAELRLATSGVPAWTVGRALSQPFVVSGGIPPFSIGVKPPSKLPRGLIFNLERGELHGTPQEASESTFTIQATDAAKPSHSATFTQTLVVHPRLAFGTPPLIGVALGRTTDVDLGRWGGTDPLSLSDVVAALPAGLELTADFHLAGTAGESGSGRLAFTATDLAGSQADLDTTVVVCTPVEGKSQEIVLGAGEGATAGFYFDALVGSVVKLGVKTAKKSPKRSIDVLVIGPDGTAIEGGARKVKPGKISISGLPIPASGRYFVTLAAQDDGDATTLLASKAVALPNKGAGTAPDLASGDSVYIEFGALAGAELVLKGKSKSGMQMRVQFMVRPDGAAVLGSGFELTPGKKGFTLSRTLELDGTYGLYLSPAPGPIGDLAYKYSIKQPKKVEYVAD